ncbi:MAG TPA: alcohol dehydrogenase catalytic domain-containing protein, partial [Chthonomonadales bacterium]|nr:alcohol dehydrogenase catalytic domain-containing protein [Chthonomonadales bacterium]
MNSSELEEYISGREPLPENMLRWQLYGAGLSSLGKHGRPEIVPVPHFSPAELLVRQDACGLCFSDTKVIALGSEHPRMTGRDLASDPVTLGHEVSCTVVGVGDAIADRFHVGDRFVIQADVFYHGQSMAYGYVIPGGLSQFSVIPKEILDGDEGCYLLPLSPSTGYAEAALTEPWACVTAAYEQSHRAGLKPNGSLLVIVGKDASPADYDWSGLFPEGQTAASALVLEAGGMLNGLGRGLSVDTHTRHVDAADGPL